MNSLAEQARPSAKTRKISRVEKITAALTEIDGGGDIPECIVQTPGAFLREFYEAWLENGGLVGGKNRNSVRKMRNWLTGDAEVRSLHPKLTGRVRISREDARALIGLFLSRWKFLGIKRGDKARTEDGYALFHSKDRDRLCHVLIDAMFPEGSRQARLGLVLPVRPQDQPTHAEAGVIRALWEGLHRESDALITVSRHRIVIGPTPVETLRRFWHFLNQLYIDDEKDHFPERLLIWIVDFGSRLAEHGGAFQDFFNTEYLAAQFRAFATFDSINDEEIRNHGKIFQTLRIPNEIYRIKRWRWLCDRTVIIAQNLRQEEFAQFYGDEDEAVARIRLKDIGVTAEHVLPSTLPDRWGKKLRELYGKGLKSADDASFGIFFRRSRWDGQPGTPDLRYFASASVPQDARLGSADWADAGRSVELHSPGTIYDDAFRIVYWAACHRLQRFDESDDKADAEVAFAYLRKLRFQVLRLPDFLRVQGLPQT